MTDIDVWEAYWRQELARAEAALQAEPFAAVRAQIRARIANYQNWIATVENSK